MAAPDVVLGDAERFVGRSLFRKVALVQQDAAAIAYRPVKKAVTLKDAGVDPPGIEQSREEVLGSSFKRNSV
uniref:Uncharacterized protein n=1 Tax=Arundo donax TaxID=35708 RepID=A0A0A9A2F2_ARUDO